MSDKTTVSLRKPIIGGDGVPITAIELREPTGKEVFLLGEPQTWVRSGGGMALIDNDQAIMAYAERCIVKPDPVLAMAQMGVLDALAVREAIKGFFIDTSTSVAATAPSG
ncbi:MAG: phage tail assembly protein [Rhizobiaceae bacterium]|nr:phage tail assembly protein [Rhizobiaceae bacterium]MCB2106354.1 phage tail assembly protein [Paracoccaceae bacterium]